MHFFQIFDPLINSIFHSLFDDFSPLLWMDSMREEKKEGRRMWNGRKWFLFRRRRRDANAWDANGERKWLAHGIRYFLTATFRRPQRCTF